MKKLSLVLVLALFSVTYMVAQRTITGTVVDESGESLIGVSILAKNTSTGTVTDIDGTYSLRVPEGATVLVFSYTGFGTQEVTLGASNVMDVTMAEAAEQLSEVVVTGLGIRKDKKALGYAVTTLDQSQLELKPEADVARVLRGKVPGVDIVSTSGLAGSGTNVIIRGYTFGQASESIDNIFSTGICIKETTYIFALKLKTISHELDESMSIFYCIFKLGAMQVFIYTDSKEIILSVFPVFMKNLIEFQGTILFFRHGMRFSSSENYQGLETSY